MAAVDAGALRCSRVAREVVPVMTGPEDERAAAVGGRGHLRASRTDRERVIELLKAAFVEERLDKDEFDARVVQALASRTYAELAAVTADIPADLPVVGVAAVESAAAVPAVVGPTSTPGRTLAKAAFRACLCVLVAGCPGGGRIPDPESCLGIHRRLRGSRGSHRGVGLSRLRGHRRLAGEALSPAAAVGPRPARWGAGERRVQPDRPWSVFPQYPPGPGSPGPDPPRPDPY